MKCPECGGLVVVNDRGEDVCTYCGLVMETCRFSHTINRSNHIYGRHRNRWRKNSRVSYYGGNITDVLRTLERVCNNLGFTQQEFRYAKDLYFKLAKRLKGEDPSISHLKIAAASVYLSSKLNYRTLRLSDISYYFRSLGHRVSVSDIVKISILVRSSMIIDFNVDRRLVISKLIFHLIMNSNEIGVDLKLKIYRHILEMLENEELMRKLQGRSSKVVAATLLYLALEEIKKSCYDFPEISIKKVASIAGVSISALCKSLHRVVSPR